MTLGWSAGPLSGDDDGAVDRRLAGAQLAAASGDYFRIDLPAAGSYTLNVAFGRGVYSFPVRWELRDGPTTVLKAWDHASVSGGTWYDATDTARTASAWPGSNAAAVIATTGTDLRLYATDIYSPVAHLSLSPAASPLSVASPSVGSQVLTAAVTLTGSAAAGGDDPKTYQWYRSTTSGFTPGAGNLLAGKTAVVLDDTGLTPGATYYYRLRATDAASVTADSPETSVVVPASSGGGGVTILLIGP